MTGLSQTSRWRWLVPGLLVCCVLLGSCVLAGCGSPKQRHRFLSVFFDGVPDPDAPKAQTGNVRTSTAGKTVYLHEPYAQQKCDACHQNTQDIFARAKVRADVCGDCHPNVATQYPKMHGPVVTGGCMMCHGAHQSSQPHLLKQPTPKLCVQCHEAGTLSPRTAAHTDPNSDCLTCHSGHGGSDSNFLKLAQAAPTTVPATGPSGESQLHQ